MSALVLQMPSNYVDVEEVSILELTSFKNIDRTIQLISIILISIITWEVIKNINNNIKKK